MSTDAYITGSLYPYFLRPWLTTPKALPRPAEGLGSTALQSSTSAYYAWQVAQPVAS